MNSHTENIKHFIKYQIDNYKKTNYIYVILGKTIDDNIFNTKVNESFIEIVKEFRDYKLSYSQGKIYKNSDIEYKTFNNKNTEIKRVNNLEKEIINWNDNNLLLLNNDLTDIQEFEPKKLYNDEQEYDEINIHLNDNMLLIFQKVGEFYNIKITLNIEKDLSYIYIDEYMELLDKTLITLYSGVNILE